MLKIWIKIVYFEFHWKNTIVCLKKKKKKYAISKAYTHSTRQIWDEFGVA